MVVRVLAVVYGARAWERNWRVYDVVHSKKRNRLTLKKLNDLVYISTGMRLRKRSTCSNSFAEWDKGLKAELTYLPRTHNVRTTLSSH